MSFRTKIVLATALAAALPVWLVTIAVTTLISQFYEQRDAERTRAFVAQFQKEFENQRRDLVRRVEAIGNSGDLARVAAALAEPQPDTAQFLNDAEGIARQQSLDFLTIAGPDRAVLSSAHWPARFGYRDEWLEPGLASIGAFIRREELPQGPPALGLFAVRTLGTPNGPVYVAGGIRLGPEFISGLTLAPGMSLRLADSAEPPRLDSNAGENYTLIPLNGREGKPVAHLIAANSRSDLVSLISYTRYAGLTAGVLGVIFGIALSFYVANRIAAPVQSLASTVRQVAAGDWTARASGLSRDEIGALAADFNSMTEQLIEQKERTVQAERVAAWRELARRLAHELKNPLFPLQITVENLQRARSAAPAQFDEIFEESTTTLLAELENLKAIISRFSDFSKMPSPRMEAVDLNELVRETVRLFAPQCAQAKIEPRTELDPGLGPVAGDPDLLRRALGNLVLNALDAMPGGGVLTLRTSASAEGASLEIGDTGQGLTPEECGRLFTPYYTTKHHGTGLGLAIVQSVVSDHQGTIHVESAPGQGARFRIGLRAAQVGIQ